MCHVLVYLLSCVFCLNTPCLEVLPTAWEDSWPGRHHTIELSHSLIVELLLKRWVRRRWPKIFCMQNRTTLLLTTNGSVDSPRKSRGPSDIAPLPLPTADKAWQRQSIWMGSLCQPNYVGSVFTEISCDIWTATATVVIFCNKVSLQPIRPEREQQKGSISEAKYFVLPKMNNVWGCRLLIPGVSQVPLSGSFWLYELITSGEVILTHMPSGVIIHLND